MCINSSRDVMSQDTRYIDTVDGWNPAPPFVNSLVTNWTRRSWRSPYLVACNGIIARVMTWAFQWCKIRRVARPLSYQQQFLPTLLMSNVLRKTWISLGPESRENLGGSLGSKLFGGISVTLFKVPSCTVPLFLALFCHLAQRMWCSAEILPSTSTQQAVKFLGLRVWSCHRTQAVPSWTSHVFWRSGRMVRAEFKWWLLHVAVLSCQHAKRLSCCLMLDDIVAWRWLCCCYSCCCCCCFWCCCCCCCCCSCCCGCCSSCGCVSFSFAVLSVEAAKVWSHWEARSSTKCCLLNKKLCEGDWLFGYSW